MDHSYSRPSQGVPLQNIDYTTKGYQMPSFLVDPPTEYDPYSTPLRRPETSETVEASCSSTASLLGREVDDESHGSNDNLSKVLNDEPEEIDHFIPLPPVEGIPEEENPLTVRAVVLGCLLGSLINASNVYTGLRSGMSSGAELFGSIMGFGLLKLMTRVFVTIPVLGRPFGPRENGLVQAAATGAAGSTVLFISSVPAMYQLGVLSDPSRDFFKLTLLVLSCTFFGLFAAVPLRNFFIVDCARVLNLRFPTAEVTAVMIRSMHEVGNGALVASKRFKTLAYVFCAAFVHKVVSSYATGILYDWHVWTWFYAWGKYQNSAIDIENWGWVLELSPNLFGIGMVVGVNIGASMLVGALLSWAIIGPVLVHLGICVGNPVAEGAGPQWKDYVTFAGAGSGLPTSSDYIPSPYMWLIWPGIAILFVSSITDLLLNSPALYAGMKTSAIKAYSQISQKFNHLGLEKRYSDSKETTGRVSTWTWGIGLIVTTAVTCVIVQFQWSTNAGFIVVGLILSVLLSVINIYGTGSTSIAPTAATELIILFVAVGITFAQKMALKSGLTLTLLISAITTGAADVSTNLMGDLRIGFLLGTPPSAQFWAQAIGTLCSGLVAPAVFMIFSNANPCLIETVAAKANATASGQAQVCAFPAPIAQPTANLLPVLLSGTSLHLPMPASSAWFALGAAIVVIIESVAVKFLLTGDRQWLRKWMPSWFGIAIGMILSQPKIPTAIFAGSLLAYIWQKKRPSGYAVHGIAAAAGLIAGEGMGGLFTAILQLAGVGGDKYGTEVGCPADLCI